MNKIRIIIADDHPIVRDGLISILETQDDFEIIGVAENGKETIELISQSIPDILLLDLEMPELDGVEVLQNIQKSGEIVNTIVFTAFDTDERIVNAVKSGAKGYLLKGSPREELFEAIREIYNGGTLLQPIITSKLMEHISGGSEGKDFSNPGLTERELQVLKLIAAGKPNKEIALDLVITERTVKYHVSSIFRKLDATNRTEAVNFAVKRHLIQLIE